MSSWFRFSFFPSRQVGWHNRRLNGGTVNWRGGTAQGSTSGGSTSMLGFWWEVILVHWWSIFRWERVEGPLRPDINDQLERFLHPKAQWWIATYWDVPGGISLRGSLSVFRFLQTNPKPGWCHLARSAYGHRVFVWSEQAIGTATLATQTCTTWTEWIRTLSRGFLEAVCQAAYVESSPNMGRLSETQLFFESMIWLRSSIACLWPKRSLFARSRDFPKGMCHVPFHLPASLALHWVNINMTFCCICMQVSVYKVQWCVQHRSNVPYLYPHLNDLSICIICIVPALCSDSTNQLAWFPALVFFFWFGWTLILRFVLQLQPLNSNEENHMRRRMYAEVRQGHTRLALVRDLAYGWENHHGRGIHGKPWAKNWRRWWPKNWRRW